MPSRWSKSWCMRAKGARPTAWRAHGAPASPPPLTLDGAGVLQVADGRGVHHVPHDEALDGLVLGHHHARGLAADALDLRHDSVRNGLGDPHQPQERSLGRQAGPQGARGAHMAAPMLVAASVAPLLRHVRGVQRLLCTLGPVKTHDGSGAPEERVRLRKAAGDKQAFALNKPELFFGTTQLSHACFRAHCIAIDHFERPGRRGQLYSIQATTARPDVTPTSRHRTPSYGLRTCKPLHWRRASRCISFAI